MIKNERQYRITKAQVVDLDQALAQLVEQPDSQVDPRLQLAET
jgi:hypothetical protein